MNVSPSAAEADPAGLPPAEAGPAGFILRRWGVVEYARTFAAMQAFTAARSPQTPDELWLVTHPPVFTQGVAGRPEHLLAPGDIPVVPSNRGGQVTYHGPGQVVVYPLVDLRRLGIYVKEYVFRLEAAVIQTLEAVGVVGFRVESAPGIYVNLADPFQAGLPAGPRQDPFAGLGKVAQLGIKVSGHCTYHGVSLNVAMDLKPFLRINPCGYAGLATVDLATLGAPSDPEAVAERLAERLAHHLSR
ncbi:lipoyl(octanoyl) transferase LipB [Ideonella livida]|uniref:Octanoyltransferase n=1 Tax=Ideonella livida TaxID=2707176 RepID=A0A7C9PIC2_9BURK|nr:lipoyl(octanoyl) transferase LipB [Ideonella livida]NDY92656.1 lipoyl(octanoyl) transferase LipB [Ideonella livida]